MNPVDSILTVLVNGHKQSYVSIFDRGLAYGDGVFETVKVIAGKPILWAEHKRRLLQGCQVLGIAFDDEETLDAEICAVMQENRADAADAVLKVIVTRGSGGRGYIPSREMKPTRILMLSSFNPVINEHRDVGIDVMICKHRLPQQPKLAGIKHLNRLDQIIAAEEWRDKYQEGILCDNEGNVIEGTMSNLFICRGDALVTPRLDNCGVAGVIRGYIIGQAKQNGTAVTIQNLSVDDLMNSDGAFLCNSLIGICPIKRVEHRELPLPKLLEEVRAWISQV